MDDTKLDHIVHASLEALPDLLHVVNAELNVVYANRAMRRVTRGLGKSAGLWSERLPDLFPFLPKATLEHYRTAFQTGRTARAETSLLVKNRAYHAEFYWVPIHSGGTVTHVVTLIRDLTRLNQTERALNESENRFRRITGLMLDLVVEIDLTGMIIYASPSHTVVTGWRPEQLVGTYTFQYQHPDDTPHVTEVFRAGTERGSSGKLAYRIRKADGSYIWVETVGNPVFDESGNCTGAILSSRDIDEMKRTQDRLEYLAHHDPLTGLYNRHHFERELARQSQQPTFPLTVLVFDVDGLKLVNDTLGLAAGDLLLQACAGILRENCDAADILCRTGGDEFAVLSPNRSQTGLDQKIEAIRHGIREHNRIHPDLPLSIAIGYATRTRPEPALIDLFKDAGKHMYREKLLHSQSARSAIVEVVMKALEVRDFITEGHTDRLQDLVSMIARALRFDDQQLNDLCLFARFHDIGKVGIPDRILFKPAALTPEEFEEMKTHSEIGYRIALSSPELIPIADLILKHHEWYNGKGYPFGLAEENIPIECRILAIADAYDAMSNDRPYRKAMGKETIVQEIRRCAGTQFDPHLVAVFLEVIDSTLL
ncbi:MAG: HD domain-containing phosphohydrolase [Solirubrobacterales bacterium]